MKKRDSFTFGQAAYLFYIVDTLKKGHYASLFSSVRHNQSNRENFIRVPSNASPSSIKQLLVRKYRARVDLIVNIFLATILYKQKKGSHLSSH